MSLSFKKDKDNNVIMVSGDTQDVKDFVDNYQDNLWPSTEGSGGWRSHKGTVENHESIKSTIEKNGYVNVSVAENITQKAFIDCFLAYAIKDLGLNA